MPSALMKIQDSLATFHSALIFFHFVCTKRDRVRWMLSSKAPWLVIHHCSQLFSILTPLWNWAPFIFHSVFGDSLCKKTVHWNVCSSEWVMVWQYIKNKQLFDCNFPIRPILFWSLLTKLPYFFSIWIFHQERNKCNYPRASNCVTT